MVSLKLFASVIAELTGVSAIALYERQRALIRAGVLPTPVGRGRGNGLPASPETVSWLLIALLVTDSLSETDKRVAKWGSAKFDPIGNLKRCGLTGKTNFRSALASIISSETIAARADDVEVHRVHAFARINYQIDKRYFHSTFGEQDVGGWPNFSVTAVVKGHMLLKVALALKHIANGGSLRSWADEESSLRSRVEGPF